MPNSLRCKLAKLKHKGQITPEEYRILVDKLEGQDRELRGSGEWNMKYQDEMAFFTCNKCHKTFIETSRFCPNCGRDMGGAG